MKYEKKNSNTNLGSLFHVLQLKYIQILRLPTFSQEMKIKDLCSLKNKLK